MKVPSHLQVGACSHTGLVRANNEDDYLLGGLPAPGPFFAAIADGMGGLAGGAEASRTALRAAAAAVLDGASKVPLPQRVLDGFAAASARVFDASNAVPALRDMGTTLTTLCLADGSAIVGHVGDTRLYRVRAGRCERLTEDHAIRQPDNLLTRCIGAGHASVEADHAVLPVVVGDRFVLVSDGVWGVLPEPVFVRLAGRGTPQTAAEALVGEALALGGPDNATAVVVDVGAAAGETSVDCELPRDERPGARAAWPRPRSLRAPFWPWLLWLAGAVAAAHAVLRWSGFERGLLAWFGG
jgi:serine/threonine protein phosphatase PrpC